MKQLYILLGLCLALVAQTAGQEVRVDPLPPTFTPTLSPDWGTDIAISNREPLGRPSGAGRSNGTGFVAIPDTGIQANRAMVVYKTTNFGQTWTSFASVLPAFVIHKTKMVRLGNDSIVVFFQSGGIVRYWNVETLVIRQIDTTNVRDFDVAASGAGGLYFFYDQGQNNNIRRSASADGGATWTQNALVTGAGAFPRVFMNSRTPTDTLILNYYGPVRVDTNRSIIRLARYREVAAGNLASAGFIDIDTDSAFVRSEFGAVKVGNRIWVFSVRGNQGAIDIRARVSTDAGVTYGTAFTVAGSTGFDEYWFDAQNFVFGSSGVDLVYYADSLAATSNNVTDKIMYSFANATTPTTFAAPVRISEHYPGWSLRNYPPTLIEFHDPTGEVGILWIGNDAGQWKVYYDRINAPSVGVVPSAMFPGSYNLSQNYPNPFNPTTKIAFAIPENQFVTLKVYDILGREVRTLVAEQFARGTYRVELDATGLASGVYLYQLRAGSFLDTKKFTVLK
jgi:hypothetical protein